MTGAILLLTRPAMIIKSDCRGEPRKTSAPKRAMSNREADIDIISMAQQAKPNDIGQMEFLRAQLMALPSVVVTMPSDSTLASKPASSIRAKRSEGPLASGFCSITLIFARTGCMKLQRLEVGDQRLLVVRPQVQAELVAGNCAMCYPRALPAAGHIVIMEPLAVEP